MKLYEIDQQLEQLIDPETGELLGLEAFEALHLARAEKIEGMALWYKNAAAEAAAIKEEAGALAKRGKTLERQAERLKDYIGMILDGEKFSTPRCAVTFRSSSALEVSDPAALIEWAEQNGYDSCLAYKEPGISKADVRRLLEEGVEVPAAHVVKKKNVRIQ